MTYAAVGCTVGYQVQKRSMVICPGLMPGAFTEGCQEHALDMSSVN